MPQTGSVTYRTHIVPMNHDRNMSDNLAARLHDPLWLLARQWQLGEFQGEDAGSPVIALLDAQCASLSRYALLKDGKSVYQDRFTNELPLEALLEGESALPSGRSENYHLRAEAGQHFLRLIRLYDPLLEAKYGSKYIEQYALQTATSEDLKGKHFFSLFSKHVIDGVALFQEIKSYVLSDKLPALPVIEQQDQAALLDVAKRWIEWFQELYGLQFSGSAWSPTWMEYGVAVSAQGNFTSPPNSAKEVRLDVDDGHGGRLDWFSFDVDSAPTVQRELNPDKPPVQLQRALFPTPLRFKGMPTARYWEFEDGEVNLGKVSVAPENLPHLLMLEFMLVYGNDFFMFPIEMDVGSVCQLNNLTVLDTFGQRTKIGPSSQPAWTMYSLSYDELTNQEGSANIFFLAPALGPSFEGQPLEQVRFLRDEMANMVWAVERRVLGQNGQPLDRFEESQTHQPASNSERSAQQGVLYNLSSAGAVPQYWFPFIPTPDLQSAYTLKPGRLLQGLKPQQAPRPWGEILSQTMPQIPEEVIPREGVEITRSYQLARWLDGRTILWLGRRRRPGRGEGSSGLRYDYLLPDLPNS